MPLCYPLIRKSGKYSIPKMRFLICLLLLLVSALDAQETAPGAKLYLNVAHNGEIGVLAFSPDGKILASGGMNDSAIKFWNYKTGKLLRVLEGHRSGITGLAFSPDGAMLV